MEFTVIENLLSIFLGIISVYILFYFIGTNNIVL